MQSLMMTSTSVHPQQQQNQYLLQQRAYQKMAEAYPGAQVWCGKVRNTPSPYKYNAACSSGRTRNG